MRYTKLEVTGMFRRLIKAMRERDLVLDYSSIYGGYVIEKKDLNGGISHPFGAMRRNAAEMYLSMHMTTQALEEIAYKKQQSDHKEACLD